MATPEAPRTVLIVGAGEFGLSTALSLLKRPRFSQSRITVIDSATQLPNPAGSSVDASRIIRADYGNALYARLAAQAQVQWRDTSDEGWGGQGRYFEPGFVLTADSDETAGYVKRSLVNVKEIAEQSTREAGGRLKRIEVLEGPAQIKKASGHEGVSGTWGYVNYNSGWADAEKCVAYALRKLKGQGEERVRVRSGCKVQQVLTDHEGTGRSKCMGVRLESGEELRADLTILAAGAWTPSLIDLQGRCVATAQVLTYTAITDEEQKSLQDNPTVMNLSRGMFIIPPRGRELKVARHGYGYRNLQRISKQQLLSGRADEYVEVSVPWVGIPAPDEGLQACREALQEMLPSYGDRPFKNSRLCWYCDTPDGDFLITHHPEYQGMFVATGGSGHGFKFFPVIGEKIADAIEGKLDPELRHAWRWRGETFPDFQVCDDGSRAGPRGMLLSEEMAKGWERRGWDWGRHTGTGEMLLRRGKHRFASTQSPLLPSRRARSPPSPSSVDTKASATSSKRSGKGYLWACSVFGVTLGIYFVSLGISVKNAMQQNRELDIDQNADVSYRWKDEKRNFDHEVDNAESAMLMRAKRRRLISEAYGNVLEVSVGTGRNFELYDFRPFDPKEDAKYGRSRTRIITDVTFNDQSEVMVDQAMSKFMAMEAERKEDQRFSGRVRFIVGDAGVDGVIDRPKGGYDTIVQTFGICSMADPVGFLRKLGSLCRQPGEATTSKLSTEDNDGKGGRILLLEHGRGRYGWLNNLLDSVAKVHALHYGCWWNKDIDQVIAQSGLEVERVRRYHGGTTWEIVLRPTPK
ncbi:uncharacterized protein HMPREF1541_03378 [Cyphellophora europaea CBS 101466]|uniref:FAD dependent oxidoreductase domain-containing protein n=1 Tax=Cyphellophora europaea (strain CBS 101466) TaxID=1220924 RepID=W2RYD6_CYPE1|nr:uncharacterized protein HMPREF1541_03378 [Cyphellophora europaea CBS 101466]ETN41442.1 hypothetical protein HMPREF1541_03378 [Cyphellophora europaea CBS 101466]